jgi:hypothetical protein
MRRHLSTSVVGGGRDSEIERCSMRGSTRSGAILGKRLKEGPVVSFAPNRYLQEHCSSLSSASISSRLATSFLEQEAVRQDPPCSRGDFNDKTCLYPFEIYEHYKVIRT